MAVENRGSHNHQGLVIIRQFTPDPPGELAARLQTVFNAWLFDPSATIKGKPPRIKESDDEKSRRDYPSLDI